MRTITHMIVKILLVGVEESAAINKILELLTGNLFITGTIDVG